MVGAGLLELSVKLLLAQEQLVTVLVECGLVLLRAVVEDAFQCLVLLHPSKASRGFAPAEQSSPPLPYAGASKQPPYEQPLQLHPSFLLVPGKRQSVPLTQFLVLLGNRPRKSLVARLVLGPTGADGGAAPRHKGRLEPAPLHPHEAVPQAEPAPLLQVLALPFAQALREGLLQGREFRVEGGRGVVSAAPVVHQVPSDALATGHKDVLLPRMDRGPQPNVLVVAVPCCKASAQLHHVRTAGGLLDFVDLALELAAHQAPRPFFRGGSCSSDRFL